MSTRCRLTIPKVRHSEGIRVRVRVSRIGLVGLGLGLGLGAPFGMAAPRNGRP